MHQSYLVRAIQYPFKLVSSAQHTLTPLGCEGEQTSGMTHSPVILLTTGFGIGNSQGNVTKAKHI